MSREDIIVSADDSEIYESINNINKKKKEYINDLFNEIQEYNKYSDLTEDNPPLNFEDWQKSKKDKD